MQSNFIKVIVSCVIYSTKVFSITRGAAVRSIKVRFLTRQQKLYKHHHLEASLCFPLPLELIGKIGHMLNNPLYSIPYGTLTSVLRPVLY